MLENSTEQQARSDGWVEGMYQAHKDLLPFLKLGRGYVKAALARDQEECDSALTADEVSAHLQIFERVIGFVQSCIDLREGKSDASEPSG